MGCALVAYQWAAGRSLGGWAQCNYLHENGGECGVDHKRHQEQEGKQAECAEQDKKGRCVEESLLSEGLRLVRLAFHAGVWLLVGRKLSHPYPFVG